MVSGGVCFECDGGIVPSICHSGCRRGSEGRRATPVRHPDLLPGMSKVQTDHRGFLDRLNIRRLPPSALSSYLAFGDTFAFLPSPFLSSRLSTRFPPQRFFCRIRSLQVPFRINAVMKKLTCISVIHACSHCYNPSIASISLTSLPILCSLFTFYSSLITAVPLALAIGLFGRGISYDLNFDLVSALKSAAGGGLAGAAAMVVQVLTLMPMRTIMNYQYRYGGGLKSAAVTLYEDGGFKRYYAGLTAAL